MNQWMLDGWLIEDVEHLFGEIEPNESKNQSDLPAKTGVAGSSVVAETRFNVKSLRHLIGISEISAKEIEKLLLHRY